MLILKVMFWFSVIAVFYAYTGYPLLLWFIAFIRKSPVKKDDITPSVSLVISAYNEEKILAKRIENALELDYPEDILQIAVISDGSRDGTNEIIGKYSEQHGNITQCIVPNNKGKTACLNDFVPELRGEVILFSDANSFYSRNLIRRIVRPFADERIGFVTGSTKYYTSLEDKTVKGVSIYSWLEGLIKSLESKIGSCVGADGAVFAIRKKLFSPMKPYDINDLVIPLAIIKEGYRGVLETSVFCKEESAKDAKGEFRRQVRITSRTLRAIFDHKILLNPFRYPVFSFEVFSHKLMRYMTPFWMLLILIINIVLAWNGHLFYKITFALQLCFYIFAFIGSWQKSRLGKSRLISPCYLFVLINTAYLTGWFKYLTGKTYTSWKPER